MADPTSRFSKIIERWQDDNPDKYVVLTAAVDEAYSEQLGKLMHKYGGSRGTWAGCAPPP